MKLELSSFPVRPLLHKAVLTGITAVLAGTSGAFFLWSLDAVTRVRLAQPWLLWCLPFTGMAVALIYQKWGSTAERGTGLILDEIHEPGGGVPARMAPLVLLGTLATHLGGGSAGREGTAVQMGGSLAGWVGRRGRLGAGECPGLLMAGVAAGFGAVFGTPWAGAVFAVEVLRQRRGRLKEWPWCVAAAFCADRVCHAWGGHHTAWPRIPFALFSDIGMWGGVLIAAMVFGLVAWAFVGSAHLWQAWMKRWLPWAPLRPLLGGFLVIALVSVCGTRDYLGLGTLAGPQGLTLESFFHGFTQPWETLSNAKAPPVIAEAWAWKLVFTVVTVGSGFKGGEVTPLFFIGAALGQTLSFHLNGLHHAEAFAALGMVTVFSAAARTPITGLLLAVELFGPGLTLPAVLSCGMAVLFRHRGIYHAAKSLAAGP